MLLLKHSSTSEISTYIAYTQTEPCCPLTVFPHFQHPSSLFSFPYWMKVSWLLKSIMAIGLENLSNFHKMSRFSRNPDSLLIPSLFRESGKPWNLGNFATIGNHNQVTWEVEHGVVYIQPCKSMWVFGFQGLVGDVYVCGWRQFTVLIWVQLGLWRDLSTFCEMNITPCF